MGGEVNENFAIFPYRIFHNFTGFDTLWQVPLSEAAYDAFMTPHRHTNSRADKMQPVVSSAMKLPLTA
jgi:hypothetical protein